MAIKAESGKCLRAFMLDINPFSTQRLRRVLIDEYGLVFVPGWGWSSLQDSYSFKVLKDVIEPFRNEMKDADWWETKGWLCIAWAWCYMNPTASFQACRIDGNTIFAV